LSNDLNSAPPPQGPALGQATTSRTATLSAGKVAPPAPNKYDELRLLINSRHPIITVETTEEAQRLLAALLTWMQDRESGVFLAATSNKHHGATP
jgi:hypothetical protein